jgi:hypothetical protein
MRKGDLRRPRDAFHSAIFVEAYGTSRKNNVSNASAILGTVWPVYNSRTWQVSRILPSPRFDQDGSFLFAVFTLVFKQKFALKREKVVD